MTQRIVIIGDGIEGWLLAGLLARLLRALGTVIMVPAGAAEHGRTALPPGIAAAHRTLAIPNATIDGIGSRQYGIYVRSGDAELRIPYGRYGDPRHDEFAGQWLRLRALGRVQSLSAYSANAALMAGARLNDTPDAAVAQSVVTGWEVDTTAYRGVIEQAALAQGVSAAAPFAGVKRNERGIASLALSDAGELAADLFVDASGVTASDASDGWRDNCLVIGTAALRLHGPGSFGLSATLSAAARLVELLPRPAAVSILAAEYRRQCAAEHQAIAAADAALQQLSSTGRSSPPLLAEHEQRYRAAGLLPADGQPWHPDQWLSCFDAAGLVPARHNPGIDRYDAERAAAALSRWATAITRSLAARGTARQS